MIDSKGHECTQSLESGKQPARQATKGRSSTCCVCRQALAVGAHFCDHCGQSTDSTTLHHQVKTKLRPSRAPGNLSSTRRIRTLWATYDPPDKLSGMSVVQRAKVRASLIKLPVSRRSTVSNQLEADEDMARRHRVLLERGRQEASINGERTKTLSLIRALNVAHSKRANATFDHDTDYLRAQTRQQIALALSLGALKAMGLADPHGRTEAAGSPVSCSALTCFEIGRAHV